MIKNNNDLVVGNDLNTESIKAYLKQIKKGFLQAQVLSVVDN